MNPCPRCIKGRLLRQTCLNCGYAEEVIPADIREEAEAVITPGKRRYKPVSHGGQRL